MPSDTAQPPERFSEKAHLIDKLLPASSLILFAALFIARGGKWEIAGGFITGLLMLAAALALKRTSGFEGLRHPLVPAALAFFVWSLLSAFMSPSLWRASLPLLKIAACGAFWLLAALTWTDIHRKIFLGILWGGAALQAILISYVLLVGGRVTLSLPGNPQYIALWITIAALTAFDYSTKVSLPTGNRALFGLLGIIFSAALFATPSRSGLAAWSIGIAILIFRQFRWRGVLYGLATVLLFIVLIPRSSWENSAKLNDPLTWKRLDIWTSTVKGIVAKPLWGWGPGNYESLYQAEALPQSTLPARYDRSTPFAHNDFLQAAAEYGFPALVFLLFGLGCGLLGKMDPAQKSIMAATAVFSLSNFPFVLPINGLLLAGLLSPNSESFSDQRSSIFKRSTIGFLALFGMVSIGISGFRAADKAGFLPGPGMNPWEINQTISDADALMHGAGQSAAENIPRAETLLTRALHFQPDNARAWRELAHLESDHRQPPRWEEARAKLDGALYFHPTQAVWVLEWGNVALRQGDRAAARFAAHRALQLEPQFAEAALFLGTVLRESGEPTRAIAWLNGFLSRYERPASPLWELSSYAQTIRKLDEDAFRFEIARCQSALKDYPESLKTLSQVKDDSRGLRSFEEARVYFQMKNYGMAEKRLEAALQADANNPAYQRNLELVRKKK